jgi:maltooligosyltrehalose trehalohydrolase
VPLNTDPPLGAAYLGNDRCSFQVWAPRADRVDLCILAPKARQFTLERQVRGYHQAVVSGAAPESRYLFELHSIQAQPSTSPPLRRPDPASRYQPEGVHGPSQVVPADYPWQHTGWHGRPLGDYIIYELHVGTFCRSGTFGGVIPFLERLRRLGITAVELMPVAQFPGTRNWGYDGVYPFAVQNSYGGPLGFKQLVDACHGHDLAVILDVVYNHLGPEGNYLRDFAPYFTGDYRTPWGEALNFDGPESDEVRRYFIQNALYWIDTCRVDALRVDAVHAIRDFSARPFLEELVLAVRQQAERLNRRIHVLAESALNDTRIIRPRELGGFDFHAQWNDDFHHALHALLTGEKTGYYVDFGRLDHLAKAWRDGYVYSGQYSAYRRRRHGNSSRNLAAEKFVVCSQNHDQVGNRMQGERLSRLVSFEKLKLAAGLTLLSPFIPLLFMGEEYGETAPFAYFVSHGDPALVEAVRTGRRMECQALGMTGTAPDPQDEATFLAAKLDHELPRREAHSRALLDFYTELIRLRRQTPGLRRLSKKQMKVFADADQMALFIIRGAVPRPVALLFHLAAERQQLRVPLAAGRWCKLLDSEDQQWMGAGSGVPVEIVSEGTLALAAPPWAFLLWELIV